MESADSSDRSCSTTGGNTDIKEHLADLPIESVYEYFAQKASNMREVVESFDVMKEKLGLTRKQGLDVYRGLRMTLGAQGTKVWKARDVLNMIEKRANQKDYMQQVRMEKSCVVDSSERVKVIIEVGGLRLSWQ